MQVNMLNLQLIVVKSLIGYILKLAKQNYISNTWRAS
jgi:hypothetical protein